MNSDDVITQMRLAGLDDPPGPLEFGRLVRFGPKKRCWYTLRELRTDAGAYVVTGAFGDWKSGERHRVDVDWRGINEAERVALIERRQVAEHAARAERAAEARRAAMTAADLWASAQRDGRSPYLERKGLVGEACRYLADGSILVPLLRYDLPREDALRAVQRIWPDGRKRFTRGFEKPGACLRLGLPVANDPMLVCEGYATALTLRMATARRLAVFMALDAGNLRPVVELLRGMYPGHRLLICADDDFRTPGNPGRDKAFQAARAVANVGVTYPVFRPGMRRPDDTDFNDLHAAEGLGMVRRQLRMVLPAVVGEHIDEAARAA